MRRWPATQRGRSARCSRSKRRPSRPRCGRPAGTVVAIATGVVDQDEVNAQSVTGAICIYLLFGLVFLFLYGAIAVLDSGTFFAQGTDGTRALRVYFSYVTLATLGYGDYTPAGELGHLLAVLEALIGQLYLVTVIALLVSRLRRGDD
ncbi:MAG: two pore domain potassium channel family protein [Acidobacteria bacterium]|nr:two pore domain potassium channel family protein [Acidobacteriota bacterium]